MPTDDVISHSMPTELLVAIFKNCGGISDVFSLATTCRRLRSVWLAHNRIILQVLIPAFNEALACGKLIQQLSIYEEGQTLSLI